MTMLDTDLIVDQVAEFDIACEFSDEEYCPGFPAKWIGFARCADCAASGHVIICAACKDLIIHTEDSFECGRCEAVHTPARRMFTRFEHFKLGA
jgi:hypothetical protein